MIDCFATREQSVDSHGMIMAAGPAIRMDALTRIHESVTLSFLLHPFFSVSTLVLLGYTVYALDRI